MSLKCSSSWTCCVGDAGRATSPSKSPRSRSTVPPHSHGARPVHLIITMIKWIRTSRIVAFQKHGVPPLPWCEAGPPNHHDDRADLDQCFQKHGGHARPLNLDRKPVLMILSTAGDKCLQTGSKNVPIFQKRTLG